jgi:hypothetical protein
MECIEYGPRVLLSFYRFTKNYGHKISTLSIFTKIYPKWVKPRTLITPLKYDKPCLGVHLPFVLALSRQPSSHQDGGNQDCLCGSLRELHQKTAEALRGIPQNWTRF